MKRFIFPLVMACLLSTGCASTPENLQRETARVIGDISPEQVNNLNGYRRPFSPRIFDPRTPLSRIRTPLFASGGAFSTLHPLEQGRLKQQAAKLAAVFQRSSSNVEGRNGDLSLRNHQLRGLDHPRKRACLTAVHNFFLTRPDGTTAAERFFGQKPRSMFAAVFASVEIPPAPLSPPRRAVGETGEYRVAGAVIKTDTRLY
jgi:hypothetical protein